MPIDRDDVIRSDFPTARKGYDPAAVDAHLRKVAKGVEELAKAPAPPPKDTAGAAAAGKVQAIVEAAERSAEAIERGAREDADATRAQAAAEASEHVERVAAAATEMRARIDELETSLTDLVRRFRTEGDGIAADLEALRATVSELSAREPVVDAEAVEEDEPLEVTPAAPSQAAVEALEDEVTEAETLIAEMETAVADADEEPEPVPAPATAKDNGEETALAAIRAAIEKERADENEEAEEVELVEENAEPDDAPEEDVEGARIVALRLALQGKTADEITPQLARFNLSDPAALVEDVLAKAGR
jgi:DivIVA domain-containing protein